MHVVLAMVNKMELNNPLILELEIFGSPDSWAQVNLIGGSSAASIKKRHHFPILVTRFWISLVSTPLLSGMYKVNPLLLSRE